MNPGPGLKIMNKKMLPLVSAAHSDMKMKGYNVQMTHITTGEVPLSCSSLSKNPSNMKQVKLMKG